jgi:hypothetical protein
MRKKMHDSDSLESKGDSTPLSSMETRRQLMMINLLTIKNNWRLVR